MFLVLIRILVTVRMIRHDGLLMVRKEIYDCDKPLKKI
mgnify:CR=1 FL=1